MLDKCKFKFNLPSLFQKISCLSIWFIRLVHLQILNKMIFSLVYDFFFLHNLIFSICLAADYVGTLQNYEVSLCTIGFMERETIHVYYTCIFCIYSFQ